MKDVLIAVSKVADGSMQLRSDPADSQTIHNRDRFLESIGVSPSQTTRLNVTYEGDNYCRYVKLDESDQSKGMYDGDVMTADALVTTHKGHALFLALADCVGLVAYDPEHGVLMLSHLGRHSVVQDGARKSIEYLVQRFESRPASLHIFLTPGVSKEKYPLFDLGGSGLKESILAQLAEAGINGANIEDMAIETDKSDEYFSHSEYQKGHRKSDGRFAIVAMMR